MDTWRLAASVVAVVAAVEQLLRLVVVDAPSQCLPVSSFASLRVC